MNPLILNEEAKRVQKANKKTYVSLNMLEFNPDKNYMICKICLKAKKTNALLKNDLTFEQV